MPARAKPIQVQIPPFFRPRNYQQPLWDYLEAGGKKACCVWHRRAGKDLTVINYIATRVLQRLGLYWIVYPTMAQGRKIAWEGRDREGRPFLDAFPDEIRVRKRDDLMKLWLIDPTTGKEGSAFQVVGADNPDSLVGANPIGVGFSEWSLMSAQTYELIRPILLENGGWAIFIYTPRGRNHGWRTLEMARDNPDEWFSQVLSVKDTKAVSMEDIEAERRAGMPEEMVQQEFFCSFNASLVGSYYADLLTDMEQDSPPRIGKVPYDPILDVDTFWDLGISDTTAIWFHQSGLAERRLIDFYEETGKGLEHYAQMLQGKQYTYRRHYVPHDAEQRSLQTGKSLVAMARQMGLKLTVVERSSTETGIQSVRAMLPVTWIDKHACAKGIQALREYRKRTLPGILDPDGKPVYGKEPVHDWSSNAADALRTGAMGWRRSRARPKGEKLAPKLSIA